MKHAFVGTCRERSFCEPSRKRIENALIDAQRRRRRWQWADEFAPESAVKRKILISHSLQRLLERSVGAPTC